MKKNNQKVFQAALGSILAVGFATAAGTADAKSEWEGKEKCFGVAKKGMNDCHNADHLCAGRAKTDAAADEWIYLPAGSCEKIAGGKTESGK